MKKRNNNTAPATRMHRMVTLDRASAIRSEGDSTIRFRVAFSSEAPYLRYWEYGHDKCYEILSHDTNDVDFTHINTPGFPLLKDHNRTQLIGVVEDITLDDDKVLRGTVRFSNSPEGQIMAQDFADGIRTRLSVGYDIIDFTDAGTAPDGIPQVRVRFLPVECSSVAIPADTTVGLGRSDNSDALIDVLMAVLTDDQKAKLAGVLKDDEDTDEPAAEDDSAVETPAEETLDDEKKDDESTEADEEVSTPPDDDEDTTDDTDTKSDTTPIYERDTLLTNSATAVGVNPMKKENARIAELAKTHNMMDHLPEWLDKELSYDQVSSLILDANSNSAKIGAPAVHTSKSAESIGSVVKAWLQNNNSEVAERGIDQARAMNRNINKDTLYIPTDVDMIPASYVHRTYGAGVNQVRSSIGGTGVNATGKTFLSFEETLRESSLIEKVGGQVLTLNDKASLPYFSTPSQAAMAAETGSVSAVTAEVGLRDFDPKRAVARYEFSNLLGKLNGTYDFEAELYNDLIGEGVRIFSNQVFAGTGANNVSGVIYDSNILTLNASGSFTLASGSALETIVAKQHANTEGGVYVLDHDVYSYVASNAALGAGSDSILDVLQRNHRVVRTGYFPTSPARCAMFGNWSKFVGIIYGPLEITRDNLTSLAAGKTILNLEMFIAGGARQPKHIAKWTNITVPVA